MKKLFSISNKKTLIRLKYLLFVLLMMSGIESVSAQNTFELSNKIERLTNSSDLVIKGEPIESVSY